MPITEYHQDAQAALLTTGSMRLALYTTSPDETGGGVEVTGGSYARQDPSFVARPGNPGHVWNSVEVTFPDLPAVTIVAIGVLDAGTGGNLRYFQALPSPVTVDAGDPFIVETNDLIVVAR